MKLGTDSAEYEILQRAVHHVKDISGLLCEIGTREGGSMQIIIDASVESCEFRHIISIDPYGNIPYKNGVAEGFVKYDYTNNMKNGALSALYEYVKGKPVNFISFTLDDVEFMTKYSDGVPVYMEDKVIINEYALVFLDGPHDSESLAKEIGFFSLQMKTGSVFVLDDIDFPNLHIDELENILSILGFSILEKELKKRHTLR